MTQIRAEQLAEDANAKSGHNPCRFATTANDTLSGLAVRDGVTPVAGDRGLVKSQTTPSQNGIYVAASGAWARSTDYDDDEDAIPGAITSIAEGTANGGTAWQLTTAAPITLGSTSLTFEIIGTAGFSGGAHGTQHDPDGTDPPTIAAPVGLNANSTSASGAADSYTRSSHTHALDVATGTNSTVNAGDAAADGTAVGLSRKDHQHAVATAAAGTILPDDAAAEGASASLARADHTHAIATAAGTTGIGAGNTEGAGNDFARATHDHALRESGGQDLTLAAIAVGDLVERVGTTLVGAASIDDTQHGTRTGSTLHAVAVASVSNGFISAADQAKLDAITDPRFRDFKEAVEIKSTANVASLSGEQTIDGILSSGSRIALFDQTTTTEDGFYVTAAGAWSRTADFASGDGVAGAFFAVLRGTANGDKTFLVTNDPGSDVVGTDDLTVTQIGAGSPRGAGAGLTLNVNDLDVVAGDASIVVNANDIVVGVLQTDAMHGVRGGGTQHANAIAAGAAGFMTGADKTKLDNIDTGATATTPQQEAVTTENISGTDTALTDTLNNTPFSAASVVLFLNGVMQKQGAGFDYTISGSTITWLQSTGTAVKMKTSHRLDATYMS